MTGIDLIAVGDVILDPDHHRRAFDRVRHVMHDGDITVVNCDQVYSDLGDSPSGFWPIHHGAPPCAPEMLDSVAEAGVDVISFGNNHSLDWGYAAMFDCLERCRQRGIATVGFGRNLAGAREPAIVERDGTRFGFLAYCCVGPPGFDATADRPGHVPVRIHTHYEQWDPQPGTPPLIHTFAERGDLQAMVDDIARLRDRVDIVVPIYHWGVHYVPELIADYQYEVGHAAVDAGADVILGAPRPPAEGRRGLPGQGDLSRHERLRLPRLLVVAGHSAGEPVSREHDLGLDPLRDAVRGTVRQGAAGDHPAEHDGQGHGERGSGVAGLVHSLLPRRRAGARDRRPGRRAGREGVRVFPEDQPQPGTGHGGSGGTATRW